ncbi:MAG: substrate-binding domain-containing protein [Halobacterium sp.]
MVTRRAFLGGVGATSLGVAGAVAVLGDGAASSDEKPNALVAGSLLYVADEVSAGPVEAHGSAAVRRLILDGLRHPDAVALADPRLFEGVADRGSLFATNALVLAYAPDSAAASTLERGLTAVADPALAVGRTDPDVDPLGYRTVMALRLAASAFDVDARAVLDESYVVPETDLMNALENGGIDAAFAYRNMAVQRNLPFVPLPDRIDFSNPDFADAYAEAAYELDGQTVRGAPIRYAATALTDFGSGWVDRLVTARTRLREAGFVVPDAYPRRHVPVGRR